MRLFLAFLFLEYCLRASLVLTGFHWPSVEDLENLVVVWNTASGLHWSSLALNAPGALEDLEELAVLVV